MGDGENSPFQLARDEELYGIALGLGHIDDDDDEQWGGILVVGGERAGNAQIGDAGGESGHGLIACTGDLDKIRSKVLSLALRCFFTASATYLTLTLIIERSHRPNIHRRSKACTTMEAFAGVEALVFDVFGTVVDWRGSVSKQLSQLHGLSADVLAANPTGK